MTAPKTVAEVRPARSGSDWSVRLLIERNGQRFFHSAQMFPDRQTALNYASKKAHDIDISVENLSELS